VHCAELPAPPSEESAAGRSALLDRWRRLLDVRGEILKAIEEKRRTKEIGSSLAARVVIGADRELRAFLESFGEDLRFLLIVSAVSFDGDAEGGFRSERLPGLRVQVLPARGAKCERCWNYTTDVGLDPGWPTVCARCARAISVVLAERA